MLHIHILTVCFILSSLPSLETFVWCFERNDINIFVYRTLKQTITKQVRNGKVKVPCYSKDITHKINKK